MMQNSSASTSMLESPVPMGLNSITDSDSASCLSYHSPEFLQKQWIIPRFLDEYSGR